MLARAFGWSTQAFWRQEKVEQLPTPEQLEGVLEYLQDELNLREDDLAKVLRAFPEALACDVQERLAANVKVLQQQWRLSGGTLTKALMRQPQVLGYTVDCISDHGGCVGECNRCWARF